MSDSDPDDAHQPPDHPLDLKHIGNRPPRLMGYAGVLLGLVIAVFGILLPARDASRMETWETVPCKIMHSELITENIEEPWGNNFREITYYRPSIRYAYTFEDIEYTSEGIQPGEAQGRSQDVAQAIVDAYPAGSEAMCRVHSVSPDESYLRLAESSAKPWVFAAVGLLVASFGLAILVRR